MADAIKSELVSLANRFTDTEGANTSAIPTLSFYRITQRNTMMPAVYEPSLCIIVQGRKDVLLGKDVYRYGAMEFLIATVNLPIIGTVVEASEARPYLVVKVDIDIKQIYDLLVHMETSAVASKRSDRGLFIGKVDAAMAESVCRLVKLLDTPDDIPILAEPMLREIHYRILRSDYGSAIAQIFLKGSPMQRISVAINKLRSDYHLPVTVDELARLADMSTSSFHAHFKSVTSMSPLQFQKSIRLVEARSLMAFAHMDAASTAYRVGYESASQFSREYTRMFGNPPGRDINRLRPSSPL
ncbi:MAG: AraC family transcriptional regulator [Pseudohongiella sp.]|uniref:AraC family transcriptional regulator n=1 Tax=Pseudohongiella sp. TaxID=1979412 RepID=UPI00349FF7FD